MDVSLPLPQVSLLWLIIDCWLILLIDYHHCKFCAIISRAEWGRFHWRSKCSNQWSLIAAKAACGLPDFLHDLPDLSFFVVAFKAGLVSLARLMVDFSWYARFLAQFEWLTFFFAQIHWFFLLLFCSSCLICCENISWAG